MLGLRDSAGEFQHAIGGGLDGEALAAKPFGNRIEVGLAWAEALIVFAGRKPFVEVRRGGILLIGEELIEFRLIAHREA